MIPKKIFIYWEQDEKPYDIMANLENWSHINYDFCVTLINSKYVEELLEKNGKHNLLNLFKKISIPACKSDVARCVVLYYEGGLYFDSCTVPLKNMSEYLEANNSYDFTIGYDKSNNNLWTTPLFAKEKCDFLLHVINKMERNLEELYEKEIKSDSRVEYSITVLTGVFTYMNVLECDLSVPFDITNPTVADKLKKYNVGFIDPNIDLIRNYGCNVNHHHNANFHLHWSNVQKQQKLFF